MYLITIKIALTIPVTYALAYPLLNRQSGSGVLNEIDMIGPVYTTILILSFLTLVFLYCRDLERSLSLVRPANRAAKPRSVWLMFLIPYNFIEDFFIVANINHSLKREAQGNAALVGLKGFGMTSGIGWCSAQIVSLLPNEIGTVGGVVAIPFWVIHWRLVRRANQLLAATL